MDDPIVRECRGIVLDQDDDWRIVCRGFDKFFNYGEERAAKIDWLTARVEEKLDGTLCMLYMYRNKAFVATTGTPDAGGPVGGLYKGTFADLFWETWALMDLPHPAMVPELNWPGHSLTLLFELTTPWNRIVVPHTESRLTLLEVRDNDSGEYMQIHVPYEMLRSRGDTPLFPLVRSFPLGSFDEIVNSFSHINGLSQEGYVVSDWEGNRVKVKHPQYVALHHMKDRTGPRSFVEVVRSGETVEVLLALRDGQFNELARELEDVANKYEQLCERINDVWRWLDQDEFREDRKAFAQQAVTYPYSAVLFALLDRKCLSPQEFFSRCAPDYLMRLLDMRDTDDSRVRAASDPDAA